jgi:hypothetical protein
MRNFVDPWQNILGPTGRLLVGRLTFLEPDTSGNLKEIYDVDGQPLENPVYTSIYGLPKHQVLLGDSDYKVQFEAYIGNGNMENDENATNWLLYKTVISKNGSLSIDDGSISIRTIATMAQLKALGGMEDGDVIELIGYYAAGDSGMSRLYIWDEDATNTDDGGAIISSSTTSVGRWKLVVPGTYVDVRWFGDIPDKTAKTQATTTSNVGQRVKAATFANGVHKDLYFPAGYYYFAGANTVSVDKNIILDKMVRFCVKEGTSGTLVKAEEIQGNTDYLFIPEYGSEHIGGYNVQADWIDTAWYYSDKATATGAKFGYTIERNLRSPLVFNNTTVRVLTLQPGNATYNGCLIESNKKIDRGTFQNMDIDTSWFIDNWQDSNMHFENCTVKLANCRSADEYIRVKNLIQDYTYGDLGEQQLHNATVHGGCVIENCYGTVTVTGTGGVELHNASLTISGLTSNNSLNVVDSWLTIPSNIVLSNIQFRRGSLQGSVSVQVLGDSLFEDVTTYTTIIGLGHTVTFNRCNIWGYVQGTDIIIHNNNIYNQIDQRDTNGVVNVNCIGNMFYLTAQGIPARHYVHATTAASIVSGIWSKNGSSYDTVHWIRLDRTNLVFQDSAHNYTYAGNSEPYLMKWSGRNHPMQFKCYGGHWSASQQGTGVFSTTTIPFCFYNSRDRKIYVVPRQRYWKMFTVGRGYLMRSGKLMIPGKYIGIMEGDYNDHTNGQVAPVWNWGCNAYQNQLLLDGELFGCMSAVCRDADGEAEYVCSFEAENTDHTGTYSYGTQIGNYPSKQWDDDKWENEWPVYPATPSSLTMFVFVDPDFSSNTNAQTFT